VYALVFRDWWRANIPPVHKKKIHSGQLWLQLHSFGLILRAAAQCVVYRLIILFSAVHCLRDYLYPIQVGSYWSMVRHQTTAMNGRYASNSRNQGWSCTRGEIEKTYLSISLWSLTIGHKSKFNLRVKMHSSNTGVVKHSFCTILRDAVDHPILWNFKMSKNSQ
jgi:hypothetical protein